MPPIMSVMIGHLTIADCCIQVDHDGIDVIKSTVKM